MWDTLWTGASLATMVSGWPYGAVECGALAVQGDRIAWVGPVDALPGPPHRLARQIIDVANHWMTPGLIDCHSHLVFAGTRCKDYEMRLAGASRDDIAKAGGGVRHTIELTRQASQGALLESTTRRAAALAAEGVTMIEIKSGYGLDLENELKILAVARSLEGRLPINVVTTFGVYALPEHAIDRRADYVNYICETVLLEIVRQGLVTAIDIQVDELGFSKDEAARFFDVGGALGLHKRVHTDELSDFDGTSFAADHGARTADHLEFVSEDGVTAMARMGMVAVLLPGNTHILQRKQIPPIALFRDYGVPMAIATNCNPGPSPTTSMLLMMNMACVLYGLTPEEALRGSTCHAATALGLEATHGTLEVGKVADLAVWDIESPAELSYYLGFNPIQQVIKSGEVVLQRKIL